MGAWPWGGEWIRTCGSYTAEGGTGYGRLTRGPPPEQRLRRAEGVTGCELAWMLPSSPGPASPCTHALAPPSEHSWWRVYSERKSTNPTEEYAGQRGREQQGQQGQQGWVVLQAVLASGTAPVRRVRCACCTRAHALIPPLTRTALRSLLLAPQPTR